MTILKSFIWEDMRMNFTKWQACGNDFIFINAINLDITEIINQAKLLCDRHFGIGADGIIFILSSNKADLKMRIFNSDGSEAEMCGNGIRAFAKWALELKLVKQSCFSVETGAGILFPEVLSNGHVKVNMGAPRLSARDIPVLNLGEGKIIRKVINDCVGGTFEITCVSMGNPHTIIFTDDVESIPLEQIGPLLERNAHFPKKTNVEFVQVLDKNLLRMRVWERGSGITMACGTGTCAAVVAAIINGIVEKEANVILDGGQLHISWNGKESDSVFMTGPAIKVFEGSYCIK